MGRAPCCEKVGLNRGRWATEEDDILAKYIQAHGEGSWRSLPKKAGLLRCGKSCRLRWINYLRSDLRRGNISSEEEETIIKLHASLGNRWSLIASHLPGRTDNEIKNYWNSHLSKKIDSTVPSSNQAQQQEQTDDIDSPKPAGNTVTANKSRAGRTGRPVMKKKKNKACNISPTICDPPLVPKLLEKAKESVTSEFENGIGIVPMPATPTMVEETMNIGSMLLESNEEDKEIMSVACLDSSCFNDMVLNNIDGSLEDLEVDPNGVLANTVSSGPILEEGYKMAMLMSDQEDLEINLSSSNGGEFNGEWYSCNSSTNSYRMNEEEEKLGWDYWDLDGGVQTGQEYLWDSNIEEEKMLSWLWDTTANENDEGECTSNEVESGTHEKQNAMVAWLLS